MIELLTLGKRYGWDFTSASKPGGTRKKLAISRNANRGRETMDKKTYTLT